MQASVALKTDGLSLLLLTVSSTCQATALAKEELLLELSAAGCLCTLHSTLSVVQSVPYV